jgi:hypothetical protein
LEKCIEQIGGLFQQLIKESEWLPKHQCTNKVESIHEKPDSSYESIPLLKHYLNTLELIVQRFQRIIN